MKETKLPFCKYHALKCNDVEVKHHSFSASALDGFRWLASCSNRLNSHQRVRISNCMGTCAEYEPLLMFLLLLSFFIFFYSMFENSPYT